MSRAKVGWELAGESLFGAGPVCAVARAAASTIATELGAAAHLSQCISVLLLDEAAGDATARIARGIGHQIVGLFMDYDRRAAVMKQRICSVAERHALSDERGAALSVGCDGEVGQIAEVRVRVHRVVDAVVRAGGIEMASGRGERRAFAFADSVDVNAVVAGRQAHDLYL